MKHKVEQKRCFIVEGNIGSGKSTFLAMAKEYLNVSIVPEPIDRWQLVVGNDNLLEKFYQETSRWAYTFQTYAFVTRIQEQQERALKDPELVQLLERSVYSDRYCFAKNCFELGTMTALEWKLYQEWFSWLVDNYVPKPDGFIYLQTDPAVCYQRLMRRNRDEEADIKFEYIERLHQKHEDWLVHGRGVEESIAQVPVLVLKTNKEFERDKQELERLIDQMVTFITSLSGKKNSQSASLSL